MSAPEKLTIETPEQVALEFPLAGIGSRFLAVAFDTLVQAAIGIGAFIAAIVIARAARAAGAPSGKWILGALVLAWFLLNTGYFAAFEAMRNGRTPGKRIAGIRVIDANGGPVTVYGAILRNLLRVVDQLPGMYGVGIVSVWITGRSQRLGDLAAGTVVVHDRRERPVAPVPAGGSAGFLGARALGPGDIAVVEAFLERRASLDSWVRLRTARQIARRMAERLQVEQNGDEERFLEQLAAEYRGGRYGVR